MNAGGYSSNLLASLTLAAVAGVAWCVKNKLKHSKCALHSGCIDIEAQEDSKTRKSVRDDIIDELKREGLYKGPRRPSISLEPGASPVLVTI